MQNAQTILSSLSDVQQESEWVACISGQRIVNGRCAFHGKPTSYKGIQQLDISVVVERGSDPG